MQGGAGHPCHVAVMSFCPLHMESHCRPQANPSLPQLHENIPIQLWHGADARRDFGDGFFHFGIVQQARNPDGQLEGLIHLGKSAHSGHGQHHAAFPALGGKGESGSRTISLRLLVPGWRVFGLCLLGMEPSLSHSHLQQHGAASQFPRVLVGDLCTGNGNNKVPSVPSPSLEKGFGEGSLPSIIAWELSSHCWERFSWSFPVQMPEMAAAPRNLQEQSLIQHPLRLAGTRGHILALSRREGDVLLKLLRSRLQFRGSQTAQASLAGRQL